MTDTGLLLVYIFLFPGFLFILAYALFFAYLDRKIAARMQHRVGPPLFQPVADLIKMLGKEVIDTRETEPLLFEMAPLIALAGVMAAFLYIPIIGSSPLAFPGDLIVVLYLLLLPTLVLALLGWQSRNIFSAIGGIRTVTQLFIYEVPFFLALLTPALMAGSWTISEIATWQQENTWLLFLQPIACGVALIGLQAKLERTPFDIPDADTEIIAGPWTELTGRRLAFMTLTMNVSLVTGSALIAALFLGGPAITLPGSPAVFAVLANFFLFVVKTLAVLLILSSIKVATGRIRIDQLNDIGWKYIATLSLFQVAVVLVMDYFWLAG